MGMVGDFVQAPVQATEQEHLDVFESLHIKVVTVVIPFVGNKIRRKRYKRTFMCPTFLSLHWGPFLVSAMNFCQKIIDIVKTIVQILYRRWAKF